MYFKCCNLGLPCRSFWESKVVKSFWKSTSQLVTKWSYLTISVHHFPTKKNLDPHTTHQNPQTTEAVYIDVSDSKGQDPECRGWGCPEFISPWWQSGSLTLLESMQSLVYMHAGVISGCITRRLMNYTGIQGISQCIRSIYHKFTASSNISDVLPYTPTSWSTKSVILNGLSGPTPAMPRSPKLYSTWVAPGTHETTQRPTQTMTLEVGHSGLTHGPGWCFQRSGETIVFYIVIVVFHHPKKRILSLKHTSCGFLFQSCFLLIQDGSLFLEPAAFCIAAARATSPALL